MASNTEPRQRAQILFVIFPQTSFRNISNSAPNLGANAEIPMCHPHFDIELTALHRWDLCNAGQD
jgi:hypothetical protein